jgi:hypothetical protein
MQAERTRVEQAERDSTVGNEETAKRKHKTQDGERGDVDDEKDDEDLGVGG